jgi:enamine deaminase RidA (YjgF/YER057c/UK114 family)
MAREQISTGALGTPEGHFSQAIAAPAAGRMVFISGMTARRADGTVAGVGDIRAQTRQVCENVKAAVEAAGGTMADICRVDVHVLDVGDFDAIHEVRREYFPEPPPASTMVEVSKLIAPEYLIEISAIAMVSDPGS